MFLLLPRYFCSLIDFSSSEIQEPYPAINNNNALFINNIKIKCVPYKISACATKILSWLRQSWLPIISWLPDKCFKHSFFLEPNTRTLPNYKQQQEKKKTPLAFIALNMSKAYINISKLQASLPIGIPNCTKFSANRNKENNVNTNHKQVLELII